MPETIVSACSCLAPIAPGPWMLSWAGRDSGPAAAFGVKREDIEPWADERFDTGDIGWPDLFASVDVAHAFVTRFGIEDALVLGLAVADRHVDALRALEQPRGPNVGREALFDALECDAPADPHGEVLGFELRTATLSGLECSWICNRLEEVAPARCGRFGLIEDADEAERAADFVRRGEVGAEPGLWLPWRITLHEAR